MSALPSLAATLPEPVLKALVHAHEFSTSAEIGLVLADAVLNEMHKAAEAERPTDAGTVAAWQEQLAWLLDHLTDDLDTLRHAVFATGIKCRAGGGA